MLYWILNNEKPATFHEHDTNRIKAANSDPGRQTLVYSTNRRAPDKMKKTAVFVCLFIGTVCAALEEKESRC